MSDEALPLKQMRMVMLALSQGIINLTGYTFVYLFLFFFGWFLGWRDGWVCLMGNAGTDQCVIAPGTP